MQAVTWTSLNWKPIPFRCKQDGLTLHILILSTMKDFFWGFNLLGKISLISLFIRNKQKFRTMGNSLML